MRVYRARSGLWKDGIEDAHGLVLHEDPDRIGADRGSDGEVEKMASRDDEDEDSRPFFLLEQAESADNPRDRDDEEKYSRDDSDRRKDE